mgnify:FL=1
MENNFDLEYLESLYESLNVSDGAKNRFFEAFLKEAQAEANPNAKKAGIIHKFLAWLNKGTPTVESSAQTILEALAGMERIIQIRGKEKVGIEWGLLMLGYDFKQLIRLMNT